MAEREFDPFESTEDPVELDPETRAAIELGIQAADEKRLHPSEDVRKLIPQWISRFSTRERR